MSLTAYSQKLQKDSAALEAARKELAETAAFVADLESLLKKHKKDPSDLKAIIDIIGSKKTTRAVNKTAIGTVKTRKVALKSKSTAKKTRKKRKPYPVRVFKNPKTGETLKTKAPGVTAELKKWAKSNKTTWQKLEVLKK